MQINKVKCDGSDCDKEVVPEVGGKVISLCAGMGNEPKDFCSCRCAKQYLTSLDFDAECNKIKEAYENHKAAEQAVAQTGIDPKQVAGLKVIS